MRAEGLTAAAHTTLAPPVVRQPDIKVTRTRSPRNSTKRPLSLPPPHTPYEQPGARTTWLDADARIQARGPCIPPTQPHLLRPDKSALR